MALSENEVSGENTKSATPEISKPTSNDKKEKPLTKIIIRRLPSSMTKEEFIEQVSPVPDYDYLYLVKGDMSLGENAFSRVYMNFVNAKDIFIFKEKFDNYVFVDGKGHEYPAVVEFAAFQKIPKRRSKFRVDPKCNTVETDPTYLEFLESLKDQPTEEEKPEFSYQPSTDVKKDLTTPLLEYIKQRKMDKQRIREEKREERKRKEIERKKMREEDRRKRKSETSPAVTKSSRDSLQKTIQNVEMVKEKEEAIGKRDKNEKIEFKNTEKGYKKYEDRKTSSKVKPKMNIRSEKVDKYDKKLEYKKREETKSNKFNDREAKKESSSESQKPTIKKVKKYSERREERKIEAQKAEQKKTAQKDVEKIPEKPSEPNDKKEDHITAHTETQTTEQESKCDDKSGNRIYNSEPSLFQEKLQHVENSAFGVERRKSMDESKSDGLTKENESKMQRHASLSEEMSEDCAGKPEGSLSNSSTSKRNKENDPRTQRRIKNKDRPSLQIYQPGMLSRRRQSEHSEEPKN